MRHLILVVIVVGIMITGLLFRELFKIVDVLEYIISKGDDKP